MMLLRQVIIFGFMMMVGCSQEYSDLAATAESPLKVFIGDQTGAGINPVLVSSPAQLSSADICKLDKQNTCISTSKSGLALSKELNNGRFIYEVSKPFAIGKTDSLLVNATNRSGESYARTIVFGKSNSPGSSTTWKAVLLSGDYQDEGKAVKAWDNGRKKIAELIQSRGVSSSNITHLSKDPQYTGKGGISVSSVENFELSLKDLDLGPNDGCFIHMTSHGNEDEFYLEGSKGITPADFSRILDSTCGDRPTVAFVSACYAEIMLTDAVKKPNRIILTAASKDKTSFGCDADNDYVFWDRCIIESFPAAKTWKELEKATTSCVTELEKKESGTSDPQSFFGSQVADMEIFGNISTTSNNDTTPTTTTSNNNLSKGKNIALKGKDGSTDIAKITAGKRYVFVDFSSYGCGYCVELSKMLASNQDVLGTKCSAATLVDGGTLGNWTSVAGSQSVAHSYEVSGTINDAASKFKISIGGTPTVAILDMEKDGAVVDSQSGTFTNVSGLKNFLNICK